MTKTSKIIHKQPKLYLRSQIEGDLLEEYLTMKTDQGFATDSEMVRWLIHRCWKDNYSSFGYTRYFKEEDKKS